MTFILASAPGGTKNITIVGKSECWETCYAKSVFVLLGFGPGRGVGAGRGRRARIEPSRGAGDYPDAESRWHRLLHVSQL